MNFKITLANLANFLNKVTKVLVPLVVVSLLLGIIFGTVTPYVGDVYKNVANILDMLGENGLLALVSLIIILSYFNIDKG